MKTDTSATETKTVNPGLSDEEYKAYREICKTLRRNAESQGQAVGGAFPTIGAWGH